ncbi:hypothetical protein [Nitrincola alkalisediminis]|nr:hypothetical protein [Nitrincola alkalisediminis]
MADVFAAVDLAGASAAVIGFMVLGIGITLAFAAGRLGKKGINSAAR